jgi:predicted transcriptional regulator
MNINKFRESIHATPYVVLRELLLEQRNKLKLSQRDLAQKLSVPHSFICKIETGDRRLDTIEFIKYCQVLKLNPATLINKIIKQSK